MKKRAFGGSLPLLGYSFLVASIFLLVRGYQFNTDDQAEHLPQIYQMLDPELYPHDYFVNASNSVFTVRFFYEKFVLFVANTVGLEWGLFWLTFMCAALMAYSFSRIAEEWFAERWAVLLSPVLAMVVFYGFTVGGNHVMYGSFISSTMAKGISAYGLLQFVRKRMVFSGLILGTATLFQPLVGLQLFLILGSVSLLFRMQWKHTTQFSVSYFLLAAFILVPTFGRQLGDSSPYDKELYYQILYSFRNHHHFLPHLFPWTHYVKFLFLAVLGVVGYLLIRPKDDRFYVGLLVTALAGLIVYSIGLEVFQQYPLGKSQWFKTTIWLQAFSSLMVAGLFGRLLSGHIVLAHVQRYLGPVSTLFSVVLLLFVTNSAILPEPYCYRYMVGHRAVSDLERMHDWIAEHTPKDVNVLVSPNNNAFACQAKRGMPIHFQAIVHEPFFMLPWYDDFSEIYGVSIQNLEGKDARAQAAQLYEVRNYRGTGRRIDYRLDNIETCEFQSELGPLVHQQGSWILTEFVAL